MYLNLSKAEVKSSNRNICVSSGAYIMSVTSWCTCTKRIKVLQRMSCYQLLCNLAKTKRQNMRYEKAWV